MHYRRFLLEPDLESIDFRLVDWDIHFFLGRILSFFAWQLDGHPFGESVHLLLKRLYQGQRTCQFLSTLNKLLAGLQPQSLEINRRFWYLLIILANDLYMGNMSLCDL